MIRHDATLQSLKAEIRAVNAMWFDRARAILDSLPTRPKSEDFRDLWGEIKDVYIRLQHSKCAFCEKPLEGRIEQDVEHFRPKTEVKPWTVPDDLVAEFTKVGVGVVQPADGLSEPGYRFLAYHPLNYAMACKPCNSVLKRNYFPVAKPRQTEASRPPSFAAEQPLLIYPIGTIDTDPESLVTFVDGVVPQPAKKSGLGRLRALVTIAIFRLDDPVERKVFFQGRARAIELLYLNLRAIREDPDPVVVTAAKKNVARMLRPEEPFANCLRCFHRVFQDSPDRARDIFSDITEFLDKTSP
jgi:hypothetical protein